MSDYFINESFFLEKKRALVKIWLRLGLNKQQIEEKWNTRIKSELENTIERLLEEELNNEKELQHNLARYTEEVELIQRQLGLREDVLEILANGGDGTQRGGLVAKEEKARKRFHELNEIREKRMKIFVEIQKEEGNLCVMLGEDCVFANDPNPDLSQNNIDAALKRNVELTDEYDRRFAVYTKIRSSLTALLGKCQQSAIKPIFREISQSSGDDGPPQAMSENYLEQLYILEKDLKQVCLKEQAEEYKKEIERLWEETSVSQNEIDEFRKKYFSFSSKINTTLMANLEEYCETLKCRKRKQLFVELKTAKQILHRLQIETYMLDANEKWNYTPNDDSTNAEISAYISQINDETQKLNDLMNEERMKVIKPLKEWDLGFDKLIALAAKNLDPDRLKNRGGALLRDERERKSLKSQLGKKEHQLMEVIEKYRGENRFMVNGVELAAYFEMKWQQLDDVHGSFTKQSKLKRKKQTEEEARYGSCNPRKADPKKAFGAPLSKKKRQDDISSDDTATSSGYITTWGDIRKSPVKSVVAKLTRIPEMNVSGSNKATDDAIISARTSRLKKARHAKGQRRRSKSVGNMFSLNEDESKSCTNVSSMLRLNVPSTSAGVGQSFQQKDKFSTTSFGQSMFSETIEIEQPLSETIGPAINNHLMFEAGFDGVLERQPKSRSSAIGVYNNFR
nr:protein regulator of cytokinesis 1 [Ciona intestinalis]XP_026695788.1 protein regulator of cytokinesis 1 [Ciona intestinalis]XP_026695789.1 protein regulator of cytokinesis 1 [Ciona intestinalis]|eukprot:XP_002124606.1 protein regulator of cytokinesis 1 [Ciona intestinalis]